MAAAGDCLGFARGVGSARFARSATDGRAGGLRSAARCLVSAKQMKMLLDVCGDKNENVTRCGPGRTQTHEHQFQVLELVVNLTWSVTQDHISDGVVFNSFGRCSVGYCDIGHCNEPAARKVTVQAAM